MALSFPSNPSVGQRYPTTGFPAWTWDGVKWVAVRESGGGGGIEEAPTDGLTYGRSNAAWTQVLPITGGTLTGNITINSGVDGSGKPIGQINLGDANHGLSWDGSQYGLVGSGVVWTTGNFSPGSKVNTDGDVWQLYWDGYRVNANITNYGPVTLARYSDVSDARGWVSANFVGVAQMNNFVQQLRLALLGDFNPVSSQGNWVEWSGAVMTGAYAAEGRGYLEYLRFRWLQYYVPNAGWITAGV